MGELTDSAGDVMRLLVLTILLLAAPPAFAAQVTITVPDAIGAKVVALCAYLAAKQTPPIPTPTNAKCAEFLVRRSFLELADEKVRAIKRDEALQEIRDEIDAIHATWPSPIE
jgi:hypothetical protein